jgi:hypothetical protein
VRLLAILASLSALACGNAMRDRTDADETGARDQMNASRQLQSICSRDGGPCPASAVRSVESAMCVNASSMLYRHVAGYPADAGCGP